MQRKHAMMCRPSLHTNLVIPGQSVDAALDKNEVELGILVLLVGIKVLAHRHCLLNELVEVLWDLRGEACVVQPCVRLGNFAHGTCIPCDLRMRRILLPVTDLIWPTP